MLTYKNALLIVCKNLNPFVTFDLLINDTTPTSDAQAVQIRDLFFNLNAQDQKFGQTVVNNILQGIVNDCRALGFKLVLGKAQLVKGKYQTIGALATGLTAQTSPIN